MSSEAAAAALRLLLPDAQIALAWWRAEGSEKKQRCEASSAPDPHSSLGTEADQKR